MIFICCVGWHTSKFLGQWSSFTFSRFVFNTVKDHHRQLWCCPQLFHKFKQFNIKATMAHHPIIHNELDELLATGAIEPLTGIVGFYLNIFVIPKYAGGLQPMLSLKQFNCYLDIPTFKMHTIRQVQQLIQQGNYAFSIDLKDAYLHIPIVKHQCHFLHFVW